MRIWWKRVAQLWAGVLPLSLALISTIPPAHAGWTVYLTSPAHNAVKTNISINYDVQQVHFGVTDSDPSRYYFYLNFVKPITGKMFADGLGSFAGINLDNNGDDKYEYQIRTDPKQPYEGNFIHTGKFFELSASGYVESNKCGVQTFSDISKGVDWIGFSISNDCLPFKKTLGVQGFSSHDPNGKKEFDFVPDNSWFVTLDGTTDATSGVNPSDNSLPTELPTLAQSSATEVLTPAYPPADLVTLATNETKSVVTINCGSGLGSGWAGKVKLTAKQESAGYRSYVFTNAHVAKECTSSRAVTITLANQVTVSGYLLAWDDTNDVAGILARTYIPPLQLVGEHPEEGWWAGVLGSPLGFPGVLTEGIISSVEADGYLATTTAHINPGNSGGPAFDRTGRVMGLATAKYVDAEGFGIIHGAPMLCVKVLVCAAPSQVWAQSNLTAPGSGTGNEDATSDQGSQNSQLQTAVTSILAGAKSQLAKSLAQIKTAIAAYPSQKNDLLAFQALAPAIPGLSGKVNTDVNSITEFASEVTNFGKLVNAKVASLSLLAKPKIVTITCIKGKTVKKVTSVSPKCPTGYTLKK